MVIKISLVSLLFFFIFQSAEAQDTLKHKAKHTHAELKNSAVAKHADSLRINKPLKMPKYARDGYVAISYGLGSPGGAYAANAGASSGSVWTISAGFPGIISHLGIAFKFDAGMNGINQTQLASSLSIQTGFPIITCTLPGTLGQYSYKTMMTGVYLTYPSKHITIDARILGGVMFANIPSLTVNYYDQFNETNGTMYQGATNSSAFAFDIGIDVRYPFLHRFCAIISIDYLTASPSFDYISSGSAISTSGNIVSETGRVTTTSQSFDLTSLKIGVGYLISAQKPSAPKAQ